MARVTRSGGQTASGGGGGGGGLGRGLLEAFIADFILDKVGGGIVQGAVNPGGGGLVSPPIPAAQGSKYNLTAPDIIAIQRQVDDENFRRASTNQAAKALGQEAPFKTYLNANQIINDMVLTNRQLMAETGARERAIAEIQAQGEVQKAIGGGLANAIGTGLTGSSQVISQGIATGGQRFDNQRQLEELSRAV